MAGFNADEYFNDRIAADLLNTGSRQSGLSKYDEVLLASAEKQATLAEYAQRLKGQEGSLAGWVSPSNPNGVMGTLTDALVARVGKTAMRMAGDTLSIPFVGQIATDQASVSEDAVQAYNRKLQNKARPEDADLLKAESNSVLGQMSPSVALNAAKAASYLAQKAFGKNASNEEQIDSIGRNIDKVMAIKRSADKEHWVDPTRTTEMTNQFKGDWNNNIKDVEDAGRQMLNGDMTGAFNALAGWGKMAAGAAATIATNPIASGLFVAEQIPQIALGVVSPHALLATNVGYGTIYYAEGIDNYRAANNGEMPSADKRNEIAAWSASLVAAEQVGDSALVKGLLASKKAMTSEALEASRAGFKNSLLNTGKAAGSGFGTESLTEGYQTFAEGQALGTPVTGADIFAGAMIGGVAGGGMRGGFHALSELPGTTTPEILAARALEDKAFSEAVKTNDVAAMVDEANPAYNPKRAVSILAGNSKLEDTLPETRVANLETASKVVSDLETKQTVIERTQEIIAGGKDLIQKSLEELTIFKERLAGVDQADPENAELVAGLNTAIRIRENVAEFAPNPKAIKLLQKEARETFHDLKHTGGLLTHMRDNLQDDEVKADTTNHFEVAKQKVDPADATAVETTQKSIQVLINRSMSSSTSSALSKEQASELAADLGNSLNNEQRNYFRVFSEARQKQNALETMTSVNSTVLNGRAANDALGLRAHEGIATYRDKIEGFLASGNKGAAEGKLEQLGNFAGEHASKSAAATAALERANDRGHSVQIAYTMDEGWKWLKPAEEKTPSEMKKGGFFTVHPDKYGKKNEKVAMIQAESDALSTLFAEKELAFNMKFGTENQAQVTPEKVAVDELRLTPVSTIPSAVVPAVTASNPSVNPLVTPAPTVAPTVVAPSSTPTVTPVTPTVAPITPVAQTTAAPTSVAPANISTPHTEAINWMVTKANEKIEAHKKNLALDSAKNFTNPDVFIKKQETEIVKQEAELARLEGLRNTTPDPQQAGQAIDKLLKAKYASKEKLEAVKALKSFPEVYVAIKKITNEYFAIDASNKPAIKAIMDKVLSDHNLKLIDEEKQKLVASGISEKNAAIIIELKADNDRLFESMQNRPETGPEAGDAIKRKNAQIAANVAVINNLMGTAKAKAAETTATSEGEAVAPVAGVVEAATQPVINQPTETLNVTQAPQTVQAESQGQETPATNQDDSDLGDLRDAIQEEMDFDLDIKNLEAEKVKTEASLKPLYKESKKKVKSVSLWSAVKHSLTNADFAGMPNLKPSQKRLLKNSKSDQTKAVLEGVILSGALDLFLPFHLNHKALFEDGEGSLTGDALTIIEDKIQNGNYLTYQAEQDIEQLGIAIQQLEDYQDYLIKELTDALLSKSTRLGNDTNATETATEVSPSEVTAETENSTRSAEANSDTSTEETVGDTTGFSTAEEAAEELEIEEQAEEVALAPTEANGVLSLFAKYVADPKDALSTGYTSVNLIAQFFKQSGFIAKAITQKALIVHRDFLAAWTSDPKIIPHLLNREITPTEQKALENLQSFLNAMLPTIDNAMELAHSKTEEQPDNAGPARSAAFVIKDLMQGFYTSFVEEITDAKGRVVEKMVSVTEENVRTAIAVAAYKWVVEAANKADRKTYKDVLRMMGKSETTKINNRDVGEFLQSVDGFQNQIVSSIGKDVMSALGLTPRNADTPTNLVTQLEAAFGLYAVHLLEEENLIQVITQPQAEIDAAFTEKPPMFRDQEVVDESPYEAKRAAIEKEKNIYTFIKLMDKYDINKVHPSERQKLETSLTNIDDIRSDNKGVGDLIESLFGIESGNRLPGTKPRKFKQKTAKKTDRKITKLLAKVLNATQKIPHTVIPQMVHVTELLGDRAIQDILGYEDIGDDSGTLVHKENQLGVEGKNASILRDFSLYQELKDTYGLEQQFFVLADVWKNFRVGFHEQAMNLQASKFFRYMYARPAWTSKISMSDKAEMDEFLVSVAMAMGIKTDAKFMSDTISADFKIETVTDSKNVSRSAYVFKNPDFFAAAQAMQELIKGETTSATAEQIEAIVSVSKSEGLVSVQALVAYATYLNAFTENKNEFEVTMLVGADGKTNGPMLTLASLGTATKRLLNMGGMYFKGDRVSNFAGHIKAKGRDLYQDTGNDFLYKLREISSKSQRSAEIAVLIAKISGGYGSVGNISSNLRNLIKTPITAFFFGSSSYKAALGMQDDFIASYYSTLESIARNDSKAPDLDTFLADINKIISLQVGNDSLNIGSMDIQEAMQLSLSPAHKMALEKAFSFTIGKAVKQTLEAKFIDLIATRDSMNISINSAYEIYVNAYLAERAQLIKKLTDNGTLATRTTKTGLVEPIRDLNPKEENIVLKSVANLLPRVHNQYSAYEKNNGSGILMMGKGAKSESSGSLESSEVTITKEGKVVKGRHPGNKKEFTNPGGAGLSYMIHSLDSFIMHLALEKSIQGGMQALNVHDEVSTSVTQVRNAARNINQATVTALLEYSPARQVLITLDNSLQELAKLIKKDAISKETVLAILQSIVNVHDRTEPTGVTLKSALQATVFDATNAAYHADKSRLTLLANLEHMDQYTWESGAYAVTDAERNIAAEKLVKLEKRKQVHEKLTNAVNIINAFVGFKEETAVEPVVEVAQPIVVETAFGKTGVSNVESDAGLVALFKENAGELTFEQAVEHLGNTTKNPFYARLLSLIKNVAKHQKIGTVLKMVTPDSVVGTDVIQAANKPNSRGWFISAKVNGVAKKEIYVLSPEFEGSGLTAELLIHEMLHAVLGNVITRAQQGLLKANGAVAVVKKLEELHQAAKAFVDNNPALKSKYAEQVSDIHEFISWGMTNDAFQKDVMMQLDKVPSKIRSDNKLISGMEKFLKLITEALFGALVKDSDYKGMSLLVSGVTGLLRDASENGLGDADVEVTQNRSMADPANHTYSTTDIFNGLPNQVSDSFSEHAQGILKNIVEKLHGPFGSLRKEVMENTPKDVGVIFLESLYTGKLPFASKIFASGFKISDQEAFVVEQVEATARAALKDTDADNWVVYKELSNLFKEMSTKLTVKSFYTGKDFSKATVDEIKEATGLRDAIFRDKDTSPEGRSNQLSQFMAMGLGHEQFNKMLQIPTDKSEKILKDKTVAGVLSRLFSKILDTFNGKLSGTAKGQRADLKLKSLLEKLARIEVKKAAALAATDPSWLDKLDEVLSEKRNGIRKNLHTFVNSSWAKRNSNVFVSAASNVVDTYASDGRVRAMFKNIDVLRNEHFAGIQGLGAGVFNELKNPKQFLKFLLRSAKKLETLRKQVKDLTNKDVRESFEGKGEYLSELDKEAVTKVLIHSGAHVLLPAYGLSGLLKLIQDPTKLNTAIQDYQQQLSAFGVAPKNFFVKQAKGLGYLLATGKVKLGWQLRNAGNIASMYGTTRENLLTGKKRDEAERIIDILSSLQAIRYSKNSDMELLSAVMSKENSRKDGNGIEVVLLTHKKLDEDSRLKLFQGNAALMQKGYTSEIYNPHTAVVTANLKEGADLVKKGYTKGEEVPVDPIDVYAETKHLYVLKDGGLASWLSGIFSLSSMKNRGSKHHGTSAIRTQARLLKNAQALANDMFMDDPDYDPAMTEGTHMVPVMNSKGEASNFAYLMGSKTKDTLLQRDSRFDSVLGAHAASILDKVETPINNKKAVEAFYAEFDKEYTKTPKAFLKVSADSDIAELREIYRLLPQATKDDIKEVWGKDAMFVKADALDIAFGYRKITPISSIFDKDEDERNALEAGIAYAIKAALYGHAKGVLRMSRSDAMLYAESAGVRVRRAGNIWLALVQEVKDIIVIKNVVTLLGNIWSNKTLLYLYKVPVKDMFKNGKLAWEATEEYLENAERLFKLESDLGRGYILGNTDDLLQEITSLKDALERNPVKGLINAGMMPTIVEDLTDTDDLYSKKSQFVRETKKFTDKLNVHFLNAAKTVLVTQDTIGYKKLRHITQMSDFVARFILHEHLKNTKSSEMSPEDMLEEVSDAFIFYDIPQHRKLQYLDDMGIMPFIKYFMRIQKVLRDRFIDNPGRVAMLLMTGGTLGFPSSVIDSSMFTRIGNNPFSIGAGQLPFVIDDIAPINAAISLIN